MARSFGGSLGRREMRRRAAVGPVIGHLKTVCRNYLEGRDADRINAALPSPAKTQPIPALFRALARLLALCHAFSPPFA